MPIRIRKQEEKAAPAGAEKLSSQRSSIEGALMPVVDALIADPLGKSLL
jgi:hypothetical protein